MDKLFDYTFTNLGGGNTEVDVHVWAEQGNGQIIWKAQAIKATTYAFKEQTATPYTAKVLIPAHWEYKEVKHYDKRAIDWDSGGNPIGWEVFHTYSSSEPVWVEDQWVDQTRNMYNKRYLTSGSAQIDMVLSVKQTADESWTDSVSAVACAEVARGTEMEGTNKSWDLENGAIAQIGFPYLLRTCCCKLTLSGGSSEVVNVYEGGSTLPDEPVEPSEATTQYPAIYTRVRNSIKSVTRVKTKVEGVWKTVI